MERGLQNFDKRPRYVGSAVTQLVALNKNTGAQWPVTPLVQPGLSSTITGQVMPYMTVWLRYPVT